MEHGLARDRVEMSWGRLVDVHALDGQGRVDPEPAFRDLVIDENVQSDGEGYRLETNLITLQARLVVLRERGASEPGRRSFDDLVRAATRNLAPVLPRSDDGTQRPISLVARNATLVLRFDDVLDDREEPLRDLVETVRVLTGAPPRTPFAARRIFDPNHGALVAGAFHSTRVLVDLTVSDSESLTLPVPQPINTVGLPASLPGRTDATVALRLPTRTDPGSGQFQLLRSISGRPLDVEGNGPLDERSPTLDVVRALRPGNAEDVNDGFLLDLNAPAIVGDWDALVERAEDDPRGRAGFDHRVDLRFTTVCRSAPRAGDVLATGDGFFEVVEDRPGPDGDGRVTGIRLHGLGSEESAPTSLLGGARFLSTLDGTAPAPPACWVRFSPPPETFPATGVSTAAEVRVRFSEPMESSSLSPFDDFVLVRGDSSTPISSTSLIVGETLPSGDRREFTFRPLLPLPHDRGVGETYHARVEGPTDLAGNPLDRGLSAVSFTMAADDAPERSLARVLRFTGIDEVEPFGKPDLRGQFFLDLEGQRLRPRPVAFASYPADRTNPVPSIMTPMPLPLQTPLVPLGSKLQAVWRYCDLGWQVLDETKYDLDVFGLAWAPFAGLLTSDYFERFEIRLAHSRMLPDEALNEGLLPDHLRSGLSDREFAANVLVDPLSPQAVVHPRELGYRIRGSDLFVASSGTVMLPFPLNRGGGEPRTFTWRDTAVLAKGGPNGVGIPLDVEAGPPLELEVAPGYVASKNEVPSFGLPLLMEFRCFPSDTAIGLNGFDVSLAVNSSAMPSLRCYSSGGFDTANQPVAVEPDLEDVPRGGFNPRSLPPGKPTLRSDDNTFYVGQLDVVTRVSRVHTAWIDARIDGPDYRAPILSPRPAEQPPGTRVTLEFRGAHGFELAELDDALGTAVDEASFPFDARRLDPYGEIFVVLPSGTAPGELGERHMVLGSSGFPGRVLFKDGVATWSADVEGLDGARFLQLRISFVSDIGTGLSPELSAIGLAYSFD